MQEMRIKCHTLCSISNPTVKIPELAQPGVGCSWEIHRAWLEAVRTRSSGTHPAFGGSIAWVTPHLITTWGGAQLSLEGTDLILSMVS